MSAYSKDFRQKIVEVYEGGNTSVRKVAKQFCVSKGVVERLLKRCQAGEELGPRKTGPQTPGILYRHRDQVVALVEAHPDWTLSEYCEALGHQAQIWVSITTMWEFLQSEQISLKKRPIGARKRPAKRVNSYA